MAAATGPPRTDAGRGATARGLPMADTRSPARDDVASTEVVVVGGGFAGVACAKRLAGEPRVHVTLLDRAGYHQFQPLLYQVATAELAPADIRFDLTHLFARHDNVDVRTAEVVSVDPHARAVTLAD